MWHVIIIVLFDIHWNLIIGIYFWQIKWVVLFYLEVRSVIGVFVSRNKVSYRCSLPQHVSLCTNIVNVEIKTVNETSLACRCLIIKWLTCTRWHPTCHMSWQWPVTLSHSPWQSQYPYNIHAWLIPIKNILKHKCCWAVQNTFRQRSV